MRGMMGGFGDNFEPIFQGSPEVSYCRVNHLSPIVLLLYIFPNPFFNLAQDGRYVHHSPVLL